MVREMPILICSAASTGDRPASKTGHDSATHPATSDDLHHRAGPIMPLVIARLRSCSSPLDVSVMVSSGKICCNIGGKARHVVSGILRGAGEAVNWQPSTRADIYGSRARIGYTCPPLCAEVFPYEFYKLAPAGVSLVITTLTVIERSAGEVEQAYDMSMRAARELAAAGVDVVFLGGVPVNLAGGSQNAGEMLAELAAGLGIKVSSSAAAQEKAAKLLGCRKVVVAHPYGAREDARLVADAERYGCEVRGALGWGKTITEFGSIPAAAALEMGRALMRAHPD